MTALFNFALSMAQRATLRMMRERGGAVRMSMSEQVIGKPAVMGMQAMQRLGLISITPLIGTSEHDVRLTNMGVHIVTKLMDSLQ